MVSFTALLGACVAFELAAAFLPADPTSRRSAAVSLYSGRKAGHGDKLSPRSTADDDDYGYRPPSKAEEPLPPTRNVTYPSQPEEQDALEPLFASISTENMRKTMEKLVSYPNRYYKSDHGMTATEWLHSEISSLKGHCEIHKVKHEWPQRSLDVTIKGKGKNGGKLIVTGAHADSINIKHGRENATWARAPGADDNASGVAVLLEALRLLLKSGAPEDYANEIHFHFYSAEEVGLRGSKDIFAEYARNKKDVVAMLNQDMTGRKATDGRKDGFTMVTDFVYDPLVDFVKKLIKEYTGLDTRERQCGYPCSDHASAIKNGYPSAFVSHGVSGREAPWIHTENDSLDKIDYLHMKEHVKLVLAYIMELASVDFGD